VCVCVCVCVCGVADSERHQGVCVCVCVYLCVCVVWQITGDIKEEQLDEALAFVETHAQHLLQQNLTIAFEVAKMRYCICVCRYGTCVCMCIVMLFPICQ